MKILVSADWHLKLNQKGVPKAWALNRYRILFKQIHALEAKTSLHVIAGDFFDKLPDMEELALYFEFIKGCTIETIIFSGNHCALKKDTTFLSHLKEVTNSINPLVTIIDDFYNSGEFDIIPYNKLKEFAANPSIIQNPRPILFTHCRAEIQPHVKPEVDLSIFDKWKVVLAGDLHSYENSQRNILYPGSPCTTSFHRNLVDTGIIIFDTDSLTHEWVKLKVPQLLRKTIAVGDTLEASEYHWTLHEVTGDMAELANMEDNELIDKKVVKRDSDTALILDPQLSLAGEVKEYLTYILNLDEDTIEACIQLLNNNMGKIDD